jgi:hypothetical protein
VGDDVEEIVLDGVIVEDAVFEGVDVCEAVGVAVGMRMGGKATPFQARFGGLCATVFQTPCSQRN